MTRARGARLPARGKLEPHVGVARVPDARLDRLAAIYRPKRTVPAAVEVADLALAGRGTAAALLDVAPYRQADALVHVVRAFDDARVPHPLGSIDPARDIRTMEDELVLADLGVVERRLERIARDLKKAGGEELRREAEVLERCRARLEEGRALRGLELNAEDARRLRGFQLLSAKPLLVALNVGEADLRAGGDVAARYGLATLAREGGLGLVTLCAQVEREIAELDPAEAAPFLADLGLSEPGLDRVIRASYDLLGYISFFTVGENECRAWSVPRGTPAQAAAAEIHSDIARGFIRAEVVRYEDLVARGSFAACREHGELRLEGKDYVVQDGDVIYFRYAV
jgi:GTP-binding protein YchF